MTAETLEHEPRIARNELPIPYCDDDLRLGVRTRRRSYSFQTQDRAPGHHLKRPVRVNNLIKPGREHRVTQLLFKRSWSPDAQPGGDPAPGTEAVLVQGFDIDLNNWITLHKEVVVLDPTHSPAQHNRRSDEGDEKILEALCLRWAAQPQRP